MNPINIVLVVIIAAVVAVSIRSAVKHFQGKGSCCGGGSSTVMVEPEKLEKVVAEKRIAVEGMKCENCAAKVQNALNSLKNVNATVKLNKKTAFVKTGEGVTDQALLQAIESAGYKAAIINS